MANYPKKTIDPTEAALSAIQEALNVRDDEDREQSSQDSSQDSIAIPAPSADEALRSTEPTAATFEQSFAADDPADADTAPLPPLAANDDQQSIGHILRALQQRPP